jgi:hypothetical protein
MLYCPTQMDRPTKRGSCTTPPVARHMALSVRSPVCPRASPPPLAATLLRPTLCLCLRTAPVSPTPPAPRARSMTEVVAAADHPRQPITPNLTLLLPPATTDRQRADAPAAITPLGRPSPRAGRAARGGVMRYLRGGHVAS